MTADEVQVADGVMVCESAGQPAEPGVLMTIREVAAALRLSERKVYELQAAGRMPAAIRLGRSVRWSRTQIEAWAARGCPDPGEADRLDRQEARRARRGDRR